MKNGISDFGIRPTVLDGRAQSLKSVLNRCHCDMENGLRWEVYNVAKDIKISTIGLPQLV